MKKYINQLNKELVLPFLSLAKNAEWKNPLRMVKRIIRHFHQDSLYRNSIYLMLSTFVMAIFGFFFWMINTKLFTSEQIGLATALISITTLISTFSTLGLNTGLIRYLPQSKDKNSLINSVYIIVSFTAVIITFVYILFLHMFSPKLLFIRQNPVFLFLFIVIATIVSLNLINESIFQANRATKYILINNTLYSVTKVLFPLILVPLAVLGVYLSYTSGILIASLISLLVFKKKYKYYPKFIIKSLQMKEIIKFSLGAYLTTFIGSLATLIFPIIILNKLGPNKSAYYYMSMMLINLLYIIPLAISQSLFAEGSYEEKNFRIQLLKSLKLNLLLLIPAVSVVVLFGGLILQLFGSNYATEGSGYLRLMVLSVFFLPVNYSFGTYFKIKNKIKIINIVTLLTSIITIYLSYNLLSSLKLYGIALGVIIGQLSSCLLYFLFIYRLKVSKL